MNAIHIEPVISDQSLIEFQKEDNIISCIRDSIENKMEKPTFPLNVSESLRKRWLQLYPQLTIQNDMLLRRFKLKPEAQPSSLRIIPEKLQNRIIEISHDPPHCGHLGVDKTLHRILLSSYWPGIRKSVQDYITDCESCQIVKAKATPSPIQVMCDAATTPGELVTIDCLKLPPDQGFHAILLLVDAFSKFPVAYKLRDETSPNIVKCLVNYFTTFGVPRRIVTDQGTNFEGRLVYDALSYFGIRKGRTAIYHPQTDGQTERMNRSLLEMLRHYARKRHWVDNLDLVMMAYRTSICSTTKQTPALLFFNREMPEAPTFQCVPPTFPSPREWAELLDDVDLAKARRTHPADDSLTPFTVGDNVMVRAFVRNNKLCPRYEPGWIVDQVYPGSVKVHNNNNICKVINNSDIVLQKKGGK